MASADGHGSGRSALPTIATSVRARGVSDHRHGVSVMSLGLAPTGVAGTHDTIDFCIKWRYAGNADCRRQCDLPGRSQPCARAAPLFAPLGTIGLGLRTRADVLPAIFTSGAADGPRSRADRRTRYSPERPRWPPQAFYLDAAPGSLTRFRRTA